jgi:hypothetical protein
MVELSWVTYPEKIFEDFFKMVKNTEKFQSGLVVMGGLPRFFKVMKSTKIFQSGENCRDFSKW